VQEPHTPVQEGQVVNGAQGGVKPIPADKGEHWQQFTAQWASRVNSQQHPQYQLPLSLLLLLLLLLGVVVVGWRLCVVTATCVVPCTHKPQHAAAR
jgi:hypothetical protein